MAARLLLCPLFFASCNWLCAICFALDDGPVPSPPIATSAERATWERIRTPAGTIELRSSEELKSNHWKSGYRTDQHKITAQFLKTVLLDPRFSSQIPPTGIIISGAWIPEPLILVGVDVPFPIVLDNCI